MCLFSLYNLFDKSLYHVIWVHREVEFEACCVHLIIYVFFHVGFKDVCLGTFFHEEGTEHS